MSQPILIKHTHILANFNNLALDCKWISETFHAHEYETYHAL